MIKYFKFVPNLITSLNLFCGCLAVVFAFNKQLEISVLFIFIAAVFDFLDGFAARLLHAKSLIGKELDSLADLISFGVAPASMLYIATLDIWSQSFFNILSFAPYILVVFSALRLAKFNIDDRQTNDFLGLPTPANALFFVSYSIFIFEDKTENMLKNPFIVAVVILFFSILMVSNLRLYSLKKLSGNIAKLTAVVILLIFSCIFIYQFRFYAGILIIPLYILQSGVNYITNKKSK